MGKRWHLLPPSALVISLSLLLFAHFVFSRRSLSLFSFFFFYIFPFFFFSFLEISFSEFYRSYTVIQWGRRKEELWGSERDTELATRRRPGSIFFNLTRAYTLFLSALFFFLFFSFFWQKLFPSVWQIHIKPSCYYEINYDLKIVARWPTIFVLLWLLNNGIAEAS